MDSELDGSLTAARHRMVRTQIEHRGVWDTRVLAALRDIPRHLFVPEELVVRDGEEVPSDELPPEEQNLYRGIGNRIIDRAYMDCALPIGWRQTISQPYIVAFMTEALQLEPGDVVLEVGTGSGYQTAVLAALASLVYSIEIVSPLTRRAQRVLDALSMGNVTLRVGDGHVGWAEHAPFDAIMVTCAPDAPPPALVDQLAEGGRMVIPVGPQLGRQTLHLIEKREGRLLERTLLAVAFVPMVGGAP
jgi:protein-L-isoaspartate(D-aspartate) O-methyltransferase